MSSRFSYLDTRELDRGVYKLLQDLENHDEVHGKIVAKATFVTDYASIDVLRSFMLYMFYALLADYGDKSATIHDFLYSGYGILREDGSVYYPTRKECDEIFYRALLGEGVPKWRAWMFYLGVRVGGESHFCAAGREWKEIE